eukprot:4458077-Alexandrium_andersonii.AAC.1
MRHGHPPAAPRPPAVSGLLCSGGRGGGDRATGSLAAGLALQCVGVLARRPHGRGHRAAGQRRARGGWGARYRAIAAAATQEHTEEKGGDGG